MPALSPLMTVMIKAAEKAGRSLVRDFGEVENLQISPKGPGDFVSAADHRSEEIIYNELKKSRPDFGFLMEERGKIDGNDKQNRWIVDPLDGTTNFLHGIPHWCISIALEQNGEIVAGVIHDPVKDELFRAEKGNGSFVRNRRMRVSGRTDPLSATVACGHPTTDPQERAVFFQEMEALAGFSPHIRRYGAAALDLAYVAAGRYDGFWERGLEPWDVAAGLIMIREAGGFVSPIHGQDNPVYSKNLVAGNSEIYGRIKALLQAASQKKT